MDKWDLRYYELARHISEWSKDPSTKCGAVAVGRYGQILSTGYNGFPRGIKDDPERLEDRSTKYETIIHAEMNCIYNAALSGISLKGSTLYVYGLPICSQCGLGIIQSQIKKVVFSMDNLPKRWKGSCSKTLELFRESETIYEYISKPTA